MLFKSAVLVALSLVIVTLGFGVLSQSAQSKQEAAKTTEQIGNDKKSQVRARELDDAATPVVDLLSSDTTAVGADRLLKNSRYDNEGIIKSEVDPSIANIVREPLEGISDLPADKSDLVVEGTVIDSAAFLSNDKGAVYSEITVQVNDVLKDFSNLNAKKGDSIVTERFGGRVKYPNGQIVRYGIVGQGFPAKGRKYLLFVSRAGQGNYILLTAYELQGNKVQALDGARVNLGLGKWVFDKHNNEDYQALRKATEQAIQNDPDGIQKRRFNP
jgi:hypothetical protein